MEQESEQFLIDLSDWKPDISYAEGVGLCEKLKLIERMELGDLEYVRFTQKGINVIKTIMQLATNTLNPENILKKN